MLTQLVDHLLTQGEYAEIRRCSERTIERERSSGTGCCYVKLGRSVRYRRRDVIDFIERNPRNSTSERAFPSAAASRSRNSQDRAADLARADLPTASGTAAMLACRISTEDARHPLGLHGDVPAGSTTITITTASTAGKQ